MFGLFGKKRGFCKKFGKVTIKTVNTGDKGVCLEASLGKKSRILMEFCNNDYITVPDGSNAYFFGNKLIIVTRWSDMSDEERRKVETANLAIVLHPYACVQVSLNVGGNWGDVMVNLHHCAKEFNNENAPVDEVIFLFADAEDESYISCRSVKLPEFIGNFLQSCNLSSYDMLKMDGVVDQLRFMAQKDKEIDFYERLYDACWEKTEKFYKEVTSVELNNVHDGIYLLIDKTNKVTKAFQNT